MVRIAFRERFVKQTVYKHYRRNRVIVIVNNRFGLIESHYDQVIIDAPNEDIFMCELRVFSHYEEQSR